MINIVSVEWKNFMGYQDYWTKLSDLDKKEIYFVYGEKDGDPDKRNAAGKSSIIQAIVWCLFGKTTFDEQVGDNIVNWFTKKDCIVKITTADGYEIIRTRKCQSKSELIVLKNGDDVTLSTNTNAQENLNSIFNIDYHTFKSSEIFGQMSFGFMGLTELKRRKILERFMHMGSFSDIAETAKAKVSASEKELDILKVKNESLESNIQQKLTMISELRDKENNFASTKLDRISDIKNDLSEKKNQYISEVGKIDAKIEELSSKASNISLPNKDELVKQWAKYESRKTEVEKVKEQISNYKSRINSLNDKIENLLSSKSDLENDDIKLIDIELLESKIKDHQKILDAIDAKRSELSDINVSIQVKNSSISQLDADISKINKYGPICNSCDQKIPDEHKQGCLKTKSDSKEAIESELSELIAQQKRTKDFIEKATKLSNDKKPDISLDNALKNNERFNSIKDRIAKAADSIETIKSEIKSIIVPSALELDVDKPLMTINEYDSALDNKNNISDNIKNLEDDKVKLKNNFKTEITKRTDEISKINSEDNPHINIIKSVNDSILNLKNDQVELLKKINESKILIRHITYIKDSYGNKKKIKAYWISKLIPFINKRLRFYLDTFEIEDIVEFDELLNVKSNRWSILYHSGGEQMRINLAMMFSLHDLHISVFGSQSNIMMLDEVDGALDPVGIDAFASILSDDIINRNDGPTSIFVVSHRLEMKDKFNNKISVKNNGGRAFIEHE